MSKAAALAEKHRDAPGDPDVRLWLRLLGCTAAIEKSVQRLLADRFGTSLPRFDVLAALDRLGEPSMGDLSQALLVSNGNVTQLVRKLAADGLVRAFPDPRDRRVTRVRITPAGARHFATVAAAHHDRIGALFAALDGEDHARLHAALGALKASIATASAEEPA